MRKDLRRRNPKGFAHWKPTMLALVLSVGSCRRAGPAIDAEMTRLGVRSALVIRAEAIDERPVWSPRGDSLAFNFDEHWNAVRLQPVTLVAATWMGKEPIGVAQPSPRVSSLKESIVKKWEASGAYGDRKVRTRDGATIELRLEDLGTSLIVTRSGANPETLWSSRMTNCYALALSPDERLVAYICEQVGLIVTRP